MKLYRSLEFSKLIWLISDETISFWNNQNLQHKVQTTDKSSNWWLNSAFENKRRYIIYDICKNQSPSFFEKSIEFNAMQGGRFNPSKSFGCIYSSTSALTSALEVVYHQFNDIYPLYKSIDKNRNRFTSSFNVEIPKKLDLIIVAFEFETGNDFNVDGICEDTDTLIDTCQQLGFSRYIGENFTRDFIFGNDYEISRLLGTYKYSTEIPSFKVPSARIDFEEQDELGIRNVVISEKDFNCDNFKLTGNFYEYYIQVDLEVDEFGLHPINVQILDETENKNKNVFHLQPIPTKSKNPRQFKRYEPNIEDSNKSKYFREVEIQKFINVRD